MLRVAIPSLSLCLLLTGCATQSVQLAAAKPIPAERIFNSALIQKQDGLSEVCFVRDTGFAGFASSARLSLDSHAFADLNTGETISIYLKPSIYHFSVIPSLAHLVGGATPRELEIEVKPNRRFVIRVGFDGGGMIFVPLTY